MSVSKIEEIFAFEQWLEEAVKKGLADLGLTVYTSREGTDTKRDLPDTRIVVTVPLVETKGEIAMVNPLEPDVVEYLDYMAVILISVQTERYDDPNTENPIHTKHQENIALVRRALRVSQNLIADYLEYYSLSRCEPTRSEKAELDPDAQLDISLLYYDVDLRIKATAWLPPEIAENPTTTAADVNTAAVFTVVAERGASFLWEMDYGDGFAALEDGGAYSGVTTATLTIDTVGGELDGADVRVTVTNAFGSVTSTVATLNVTGLEPDIVEQPLSGATLVSDTITLTITATEALTYQWQMYVDDTWVNVEDGGDVNGATTDTLTIANASTADSGDYRCIVANGGGSVTSDAATIVVSAYISGDWQNYDASLDGAVVSMPVYSTRASVISLSTSRALAAVRSSSSQYNLRLYSIDDTTLTLLDSLLLADSFSFPSLTRVSSTGAVLSGSSLYSISAEGDTLSVVDTVDDNYSYPIGGIYNPLTGRACYGFRSKYLYSYTPLMAVDLNSETLLFSDVSNRTWETQTNPAGGVIASEDVFMMSGNYGLICPSVLTGFADGAPIIEQYSARIDLRDDIGNSTSLSNAYTVYLGDGLFLWNTTVTGILATVKDNGDGTFSYVDHVSGAFTTYSHSIPFKRIDGGWDVIVGRFDSSADVYALYRVEVAEDGTIGAVTFIGNQHSYSSLYTTGVYDSAPYNNPTAGGSMIDGERFLGGWCADDNFHIKIHKAAAL